MDVEKIVMAAGVGFALGIGAFVLWGPSPKPRRRGQVAGLTNLGHTCFLNSLLQSLAAVSTFKSWLDERRSRGAPTSFTSNLALIIDKINGLDEELWGDVAPIEVITSLGSSWRFGPGHQDAHELFHVILSALQSETRNPLNRRGCLSDALLPVVGTASLSDPEASSIDYLGLRSVSCNDIAEIHEKASQDATSMLKMRDNAAELMNASTRSISNGHGPNKPGVIIARSAETISNKGNDKENGATNSFRPWSSLCTIAQSCISGLANETHPFSGLLTSQLRCTNCKWKSPVRYDKLESVSLPLPPAGGALSWNRHTLAELLSRLVTSEVIHNVQCDGCSSRCAAVKTLTLGKLPRCLCLHIPRTTWSDSGVPIKRDDPVIFPEILVLDPFTFAETTKRNSQQGATVGRTLVNAIGEKAAGGRHRYILDAVVEHRGPVDAGHFVAYRRGNREGQWFYTSDTTIERTSLTNVLCASPYLLFYERVNGPSG